MPYNQPLNEAPPAYGTQFNPNEQQFNQNMK